MSGHHSPNRPAIRLKKPSMHRSIATAARLMNASTAAESLKPRLAFAGATNQATTAHTAKTTSSTTTVPPSGPGSSAAACA